MSKVVGSNDPMQMSEAEKEKALIEEINRMKEKGQIFKDRREQKFKDDKNARIEKKKIDEERRMAEMDQLNKNKDPETWKETFEEEEDDIKNFANGLSMFIKKFAWYLRDFIVVLYDFVVGSIVGGYAVDEMMDIIFSDFLLDEWLSQFTLDYLKKQVNIFHGQRRSDQLMTKLSQSWKLTSDYLSNRYTHFKWRFRPGSFFQHLIQFALVFVGTLFGKFSPFSPIFTAWAPTMVSINLLPAQFVFNIWFNRWFAEGNIILIVGQLFTIQQFCLMLALIWNWDIYLYDLRIFRYISQLEAIIFNAFYILAVGTELDMYFNGRLGLGELYVDSSNVIDLMIAIFVGYLLIEYFPTFYVNAAIIVKEMTLNPFAWNKHQDYKEAMLFNQYDVDVFDFLHMHEDLKYYMKYFQHWSREFL